MTPVEISYWFDRASLEQQKQVQKVGSEAHHYWLSQALHPLDTLVAIDAAVCLEIIAMRGLTVIGRA